MKTAPPTTQPRAKPAPKIRETRAGLRAEYDRAARLWRYYRWDVAKARYEETGSTRRFKP